MSDASSHDHAPDTQARWPWVLAALGAFSIFLIILLVAYVPQAPGPVGDGVKTPAQRLATRAEVEGKQSSAYSTYGWVDQAKGTVRIPVDAAIDLYVHEQKKK